jgi:hypothetical protein
MFPYLKVEKLCNNTLYIRNIAVNTITVTESRRISVSHSMHATNGISTQTLRIGYNVNCRNTGPHYHRHIHMYILWHSGNEDHLKFLTLSSDTGLQNLMPCA